ncbi:tripartite tricarboxylate transporter TctB family protein [Aquamicrobium sp. LC103]|nr:tripartite tricarboxylate transporter TctB family protein [Aquamicrobium sp. LC103]
MAALIWWDASSYPVRRSYAQFGPEIFPFLVAAGLAVFAVATVFLAVRRRFPPREEMTYPPVIWVAGAVLAEIAILTFGLGFILASGTLFGFAARGMGRKPLWLTVIVGILFSAVLYILFRLGLGLSLPTGPVERTLVGLFR